MGSSLLALLAIGLGVEIPEIPEDHEESEFIDNILTTLGEPCLDEVCVTGSGACHGTTIQDRKPDASDES